MWHACKYVCVFVLCRTLAALLYACIVSIMIWTHVQVTLCTIEILCVQYRRLVLQMLLSHSGNSKCIWNSALIVLVLNIFGTVHWLYWSWTYLEQCIDCTGLEWYLEQCIDCTDLEQYLEQCIDCTGLEQCLVKARKPYRAKPLNVFRSYSLKLTFLCSVKRHLSQL